MRQSNGNKIIEAAQAGNWDYFETPFTYGEGDEAVTIDLDFAIRVAARTVASAIQLDDRYAALSPEEGYEALAGSDPVARDARVREAAIASLAYDRVHKGY